MRPGLQITGLGILLLLASGCLSHHQGPLDGEPAEATYAELEETRIRYIDTGTDNPPVVLIHGFASSLNAWDSVVPALETNHRVIALDLKGFGWSGRPEGDYSPKAQAEIVFALMDQLGIERASIVAHSWGSSIALQMALDSPDRIERIALYDAWVYAEQLPTFFVWARAPVIGELLFAMFYKERPDEKIESAFYDPEILDQKFVEHVEEMLSRPGTSAAALAAVRGQKYENVQTRYATIQKPVLLLWGREDVVTTLDMGERLVRQLPDARMVVYPRCGHFPMIEAAEASNRDLVDFLSDGLDDVRVDEPINSEPVAPEKEPAPVIAPPAEAL